MSAFVRVAHPEELEACLDVRREVFVVGQQVSEEEEIDGLDPHCLHVIALAGDEAVGTARLRFVDGHGKAERVAVRAARRGQGIGAALMYALEAEAAARGADEMHLHAQVQVVPFYEALGYVSHGEQFVEAGIDHLAMTKVLDPDAS